MGKVIIIGGGPSGMMAAIAASKENEVILLERNEKLGKKLFISGKGRCNVTNSKDISEFFDYIPVNSTFLYSALYTYTNSDTINFFESHGVKLKTERGDRVFPCSDKSSDIISCLQNQLTKNGVQIKYNSRVKKFLHNNKHIQGVVLDNDSVIYGDHFILCTGGMSYPITGSTGDGYSISKELGHTIVKPVPSLVPLEIREDWVKELQGLSLKNVEINLYNKNKLIFNDFGEMLFTHFGISGPIVLSASCAIKNCSNITCKINLKPALSPDELDKRIQADFSKYINKAFKNSLNELLPQKLIPVIVSLSNIDPDKKVNSITKEERLNLVNVLQNLTMTVKGFRPIEEAIVTSGGIDVKEIDPSTMKSKLIDNLYFAGELIDIDAYTGGFNIQLAFSTGYLAGSKVGETE